MMSEQNITERLEKFGYKNADIRMALRDVGQIIVEKTAAAYLAHLPETERRNLQALSEEEMHTYLAEHQDSMPRMSQDEFERIHDGTWEDYFKSVA